MDVPSVATLGKGNDGKGDAVTVKPGESMTLVRADAAGMVAGASQPAKDYLEISRHLDQS